MTVEGRKSPWIQPGGAVTRALDGFLPLAPCLPFVIAAVVIEVEWNSSRRSRVEAEKAEEMGAEHCFGPGPSPLIARRVGH